MPGAGRTVVDAGFSRGCHTLLQGGFGGEGTLAAYDFGSGMRRLSDDPATGVVDARCRIYGYDKLHVASSTVS